MTNYNLTIHQVNESFNLDFFYEDFSLVCDSEPLTTSVGDSFILYFSSDVDIIELSTFICGALLDSCYGFTLNEFSEKVSMFFPLSNFLDLGLDDIPAEFLNANKPFLGVLKGDNLKKLSLRNQKKDSLTDIDSILDKISKNGIKQLTSSEMDILNNFSKKSN